MVFIGYIEDDELLLNTNNKIIIFGAGNIGNMILEKLDTLGIADRVVGFTDNSQGLWNKSKDGKIIIKPCEAFEQYHDCEFIIACASYQKEIAKQLVDNDIINIHLAIV
jgi:FlaA1/EpsC-like NDP-sugar epimerase